MGSWVPVLVSGPGPKRVWFRRNEPWGVQFWRENNKIMIYEEIDKGGIRPVWRVKLTGRNGISETDLAFLKVNSSAKQY